MFSANPALTSNIEMKEFSVEASVNASKIILANHLRSLLIELDTGKYLLSEQETLVFEKRFRRLMKKMEGLLETNLQIASVRLCVAVKDCFTLQIANTLPTHPEPNTYYLLHPTTPLAPWRLFSTNEQSESASIPLTSIQNLTANLSAMNVGIYLATERNEGNSYYKQCNLRFLNIFQEQFNPRHLPEEFLTMMLEQMKNRLSAKIASYARHVDKLLPVMAPARLHVIKYLSKKLSRLDKMLMPACLMSMKLHVDGVKTHREEWNDCSNAIGVKQRYSVQKLQSLELKHLRKTNYRLFVSPEKHIAMLQEGCLTTPSP